MSKKVSLVFPVPSYSAVSFARSVFDDFGGEKLLTMEGGRRLTEALERLAKEGSDKEKKG